MSTTKSRTNRQLWSNIHFCGEIVCCVVRVVVHRTQNYHYFLTSCPPLDLHAFAHLFVAYLEALDSAPLHVVCEVDDMFATRLDHHSNNNHYVVIFLKIIIIVICKTNPKDLRLRDHAAGVTDVGFQGGIMRSLDGILWLLVHNCVPPKLYNCVLFWALGGDHLPVL